MDTAPLLASHWFRVAALKPRLAAGVAARRVSWRREIWQVLEHPSGRRSLRLDAAAWDFVGRCDGVRTMQALWDLLLAERRDAAPTQDELIDLLARLHAAALLEFDRPAAFARAAAGRGGARAAPAESEGTATGGQSLLAMRIPLGSPDALLDRVWPRNAARSIGAGRGGLLLALWCGLVLAAALAALGQADALAAQARLWAASPQLLLVGVMVFVIVKALHELGHALALRRYGAAVPAWGITLMMFTPVPWVDGSAASALASPRQRFVVSAAGIAVELGLAALALGVWLAVQPGLVRDIAFAVFAIGAGSTLLVNGNPLMRFDGYHALTDALELPNLASRSARWWREQLAARLLGTPALSPIEPAQRETPWLVAYAPASLAWRLAASIALVFWVGHLSFVLGAALAAYLAWGLAGAPLLALWRWLRGARLDEASRSRANRRAGAFALGALLVVGALPLPQATLVQGVVWLPDAALLRAGSDGFIESIEVRDGQRVAAGDAILRLASPELEAELAGFAERVAALEVERFDAIARDPERAANLLRELEAAQTAQDRALQRQSQLVLRANTAGRVVLPDAADLPGRHVKRGALLAQVLDAAPTLVRAAIPQEEAPRVQRGTRAVSVRLADEDSAAWPAALLARDSGTAALLPSAALAEHSGGPVQTDPADRDHLKPIDGVVLADLQLQHAASPRIGARAWVRFDLGHAPLALQAARRVQQLVLKQFSVAA